jgi:hypothetical protein
MPWPILSKKIESFLLVWVLFSCSSLSWADPGSDRDSWMETLKTRFAPYVKRAEEAFPNVNPYRLCFEMEAAANPSEYLGNILVGYGRQLAEVKKAVNLISSGTPPLEPPENDLEGKAALTVMKLDIKNRCDHCLTTADWNEHRRAVDQFFEIYDMKAIGYRNPGSRIKFSGLPFFSLVAEHFQDPQFQARTISFENELQNLVKAYAENPNYGLQTNLLEVATRVCDGNEEEGRQLAGLLLSRDLSVVKYFQFFETSNKEFVESAGRIPALTRLVVELDRLQSGSPYDRFSFDGEFRSSSIKNYYFWGASLASQEMRKRKIAEKEIDELNIQFPRHYKIFRSIENIKKKVAGFIRRQPAKVLSPDDFHFDSMQVMKMSASGGHMHSVSKCVIDSLTQ